MTEKEYTKIAQQHREALYRFAVRYTADGDSAWDNVQDAFLALWTHRKEVEAGKAKGWMIRVMYRQLVDHPVHFPHLFGDAHAAEKILQTILDY